MKTLLKLEDVRKSFGGVVTADHITMEVREGEIHGLIGPNGAGKTTLLNLISGIYEVDGGKIVFLDRDITSTPAHRRARMGLGRTFQVPRFLQRASIRDNLMLGMDLSDQFGFFRSFFGAKGENLEEELKPLLELADLSLDWREEISSLSFGKQKLLEIIRAILSRPKVMLLDEPAAGLNQKEISDAIGLLRYATEQWKIGIVLIEHSMDMIMDICEIITVINFGREICTGSPSEVSNNEEVIIAYLGREKGA